MSNLDFSPLKQASTKLEEAITRHEKYKDDLDWFETTRDSVVQRFEFTYEIAAKMMVKFLQEKGYSSKSANDKNKPELFRTAKEAGLIEDAALWITFNDARNMTSHEYIETYVSSEEFYEAIIKFSGEVKFLYNDLVNPS